MRNPLLVTLLILLALIPIGAWGLCVLGMVLSYLYPASVTAPRAAFHLLQAVLVLTPAFVGGILMIVGGLRLRSKPHGARIAASIGLAAVALTVPLALAYERMNLEYMDFIVAGAYAFIHVGLILWLWRRWRRSPL
jgi:hypothetical protein